MSILYQCILQLIVAKFLISKPQKIPEEPYLVSLPWLHTCRKIKNYLIYIEFRMVHCDLRENLKLKKEKECFVT